MEPDHKSTVLVTGGAGYIGSHTAHTLIDHGYDVVVIDDLSAGDPANIPSEATFVKGDAGDPDALGEAFDEPIEAVMHFAASIKVPESIQNPLEYYSNNVGVTRRLLEFCANREIDYFIFSSSAAVYGAPDRVPVTEDSPLEPINPYGRTKLMGEWMLEDASSADEFLQGLSLRYFNVAGADPKGRTGPSKPDSHHLLKVAIGTALGRRDRLQLFGTDYETRDGTCIRDFIHVSDLADLHVEGLEWMMGSNWNYEVLNCGYGTGYSVREVIDAVKRVSERDFEVERAPRRAGDPPRIVADTSKLNRVFDWAPDLDELDTMIETALQWEQTE